MVRIGIPKTVPALPRRDGPAFCLINLFRLPDIKEPAVRFIFKPLNLFSEMQRPFHRTIDQAFTRITAQHRRRRFDGRHQRVARRRGRVHHKGFVEGVLVVLALDVNERRLGKRGQHFVRRLRFEEHLPRHPLAAHPTFTRVNRVEIGVRHPRGVKVDRRYVERLLDPVRVVKQPVIGGVGDHRVHRPACLGDRCDLIFNGFMREFTARNAAENTQRITRRRQPERHHVAHHQQMRQ